MIYIFAPAYQVSGGPEALQQMCYYLRSLGKDAIIVFYNYQEGKDPMPSRYHIFGNQWILPTQVVDEKCNIVVVPERKPLLLNSIKKAKKYIWWLSKDNFVFEQASLWKKTKYAVKRFLHIDVFSLDTRYCNFSLADCTHICGSQYAYDFVKDELALKNVHYCVEPISLEFLQMGPYNETEGRKDVVLYNPSKPSEIMFELLRRNKFQYVPLKGFTPQELAEVYKSSKLYIDFGSFPGPERMPKESVFFGCNILVGKRNAAVNNFDVAIPDAYKVEQFVSIEDIEVLIQNNLLNYKDRNADFERFRQKIIFLEANFRKQLLSLF